MNKTLLTLAAAPLTLSALLAPVAIAPGFAAGEPTITSDGVSVELSYSGPPASPSWGTSETVRFADSTPPTSADDAQYRLFSIDDDDVLDGDFDFNSETGTGFIEIFEFDDRRPTWNLSIEQVATDAEGEETVVDRSATFTYTRPSLVQHPDLCLVTQKKSARPTREAPRGTQVELVTGRPVYLNCRGAWEAGTSFFTNVGLFRNTRGAALDDPENLPEDVTSSVFLRKQGPPVTTFTFPRSAAGTYATVLQIGYQPNRRVWGFGFYNYTSGFHVVAPQPAWVKSYGAKTGAAKAGQRVGLTRPTLTAAGTRAKPRITYQWAIDGVAVKNATKRTFTVPSRAKGKRLTVTVSSTKTDVETLNRTISFGKVR